MTLGNTIASYRKRQGLTQEALAQRLGVTNQAVSKWETDLCCPDTMLLPRLADVLEVSIDALFGRLHGEKKSLPWENDGAFRVVLFLGHELIHEHPQAKKSTFCYEGPAKNVYCSLNLECREIHGNAEAYGYIECGNVGGDLKAGAYVECGNVGGSVTAGAYVECGNVSGDLSAGSYVECGSVEGNVLSMGM